MTGEAPVTNIPETAELAAANVCETSLAAAREVAVPLLTELNNPDSVLFAVVDLRTSKLPPESKLGISRALLVNPARGAAVPRFQMQSGELPSNVQPTTPEGALVLWTLAADKKDLPKLAIPEGRENDVMQVADGVQMRGGGPLIYAREEVGQLQTNPMRLRHLHGAARNAPRERLKTALAMWQDASERDAPFQAPIVATVKPTRQLGADERKAVANFAPDARSEHDLMVASALDQGFVIDHSDRLGVRYLQDGSTYMTMTHKETGDRLVVLAPSIVSQTNGVINAYHTLHMHGGTMLDGEGVSLLGDDFSLENADLVALTSTHYGANAAMNNLLATHEFGIHLGSFKVVGDNQPARNAQAHLIEIGVALDGVNKAVQRPALKNKMLEGLTT